MDLLIYYCVVMLAGCGQASGGRVASVTSSFSGTLSGSGAFEVDASPTVVVADAVGAEGADSVSGSVLSKGDASACEQRAFESDCSCGESEDDNVTRFARRLRYWVLHGGVEAPERGRAFFFVGAICHTNSSVVFFTCLNQCFWVWKN